MQLKALLLVFNFDFNLTLVSILKMIMCLISNCVIDFLIAESLEMFQVMMYHSLSWFPILMPILIFNLKFKIFNFNFEILFYGEPIPDLRRFPMLILAVHELPPISMFSPAKPIHCNSMRRHLSLAFQF